MMKQQQIRRPTAPARKRRLMVREPDRTPPPGGEHLRATQRLREILSRLPMRIMERDIIDTRSKKPQNTLVSIPSTPDP